MRDEQEEVERDKAESEEDEDLCVVDEDKEEEVGEDAKDWNVLSPKKIQGKTEQVEKIDNGLQKGSKKKVERGPKIEELREEQDTHRNSIDDQNKDLYELKKKRTPWRR